MDAWLLSIMPELCEADSPLIGLCAHVVGYLRSWVGA